MSGNLDTYIMSTTMRFWGPVFADRRAVQRAPVNFFGVAVDGEARYFRKICNLSPTGLLIEDRLSEQKPGDVIELELPREGGAPLRVKAEVVYRTRTGKVGLHALDGPPLEGLGGTLPL